MLQKICLFSAFIVPLFISSLYSQKVKSAKIGKQEWQIENLNVSQFKNGDPIKEATTLKEWQKAIDNQEPAWCYYEFRSVQDDPINGTKYGKLYNWFAVNDPRGLAPKGWHIPSLDEWTILFNTVGGKNTAGYKLKSTNSWPTYGVWDYDTQQAVTLKYDTYGVDYMGFNAIPGGNISYLIGFSGGGRCSGNWWTTSESKNVPSTYQGQFGSEERGGILYSPLNFDQCGSNQVFVVTMYHRTDAIEIYSECKNEGYSVRCIKD
jgi:uncharacterized protein (TIGR02145 family)